MAGAGDNGAECVVKHKRFSFPEGVKLTRRNRAPAAHSSIGPPATYHSLAFAAESIRKAWLVTPRSGSKKSTTSVVPCVPPAWNGCQGGAGRPVPSKN